MAMVIPLNQRTLEIMTAEKTAKTTGEKRQTGEKMVKAPEAKKAAAKTTRAPRATTKRSEKVETAIEAVEVAVTPVKEKAAVSKKTVAEAVKSVRSGATLSHGVGRRKSSVARVFLKLGSGTITINDTPVNDYFDTDATREAARAPFKVVPAAMRYDVVANVSGGGMSGQADAVKLGIARALVQVDPDVKSLLRTNGLLTVDQRVKERKKFGRKAARRGFQFVKR